MSNLKFRLKLQSTHEESERVPDFVLDIESEASLTEEESSTLMLLLSEAVTNAIKHGNKYDASKNVDIDIDITDEEIVSKVADEGDGFDPDDTKNPLEEENLLDASGRGIFLIREFSDHVEYMDGGRAIKFSIKRN